MKKVIKVAFMGTQGSGKTTACYELAAGLKKLGVHVKLISESAEDCPFPINKKATEDTQKWIIFDQLKKELEAKLRFKKGVIICDRTIYDSFIYAAYNKIPMNGSLYSFIYQSLKDYDIIFFMDEAGGQLDDNGIRSTDKEFQHEVNRLFRRFITNLSSEYNVEETKKPLQHVVALLKL